jgi:hypothetical protein
MSYYRHSEYIWQGPPPPGKTKEVFLMPRGRRNRRDKVIEVKLAPMPPHTKENSSLYNGAIFDADVSTNAKWLYLYHSYRAGETGEANPSNEEIVASAKGVNETGIPIWYKKLEDAGLIRKIGDRDTEPNRYEVVGLAEAYRNETWE